MIKDLDKRIRILSQRSEVLTDKIQTLMDSNDQYLKAKLTLMSNREKSLKAIQLEAVKLRGDLDPIELGEVLSTYLK